MAGGSSLVNVTVSNRWQVTARATPRAVWRARHYGRSPSGRFALAGNRAMETPQMDLPLQMGSALERGTRRRLARRRRSSAYPMHPRSRRSSSYSSNRRRSSAATTDVVGLSPPAPEPTALLLLQVASDIKDDPDEGLGDLEEDHNGLLCEVVVTAVVWHWPFNLRWVITFFLMLWFTLLYRLIR